MLLYYFQTLDGFQRDELVHRYYMLHNAEVVLWGAR